MRVLGIDEAGRGCVLGPLCIGAFVADDVEDAVLLEAGANDSKKLSIKRRLAARAALDGLGTWEVVRIEPMEIDTGNLNRLEEDAIVRLVRKYVPDVIIVDALGHPRTIPKIVKRLSEQCPAADWTMEPKADGTYPVVGAASIFAKTTRDALLDAVKVEHGDLGSGYPSDPKTRAWLLEWARTKRPWPWFVRTRWGTVKDLEQQSLL